MALLWPSLAAAVPYGLEVQMSYNGLTLNSGKGGAGSGALVNYTYIITEIGGFDDADLRVSAVESPSIDGEIALPGFYGGRTITLTGFIFALNPYQLRVAQQNLREAFNSFIERPLRLLTGDAATGDVFINCRKVAPLSMRESVGSPSKGYRRDFMVTLRASDPRWLAQTATTVASATNPSNNANLSCPNNGNYTVYPVITVHGPFNANLIITNTTTGLLIRFDTALLSTNTLVVDVKARTVKDSQSGNALKFSYLDPGTTWPVLVPGAQNIQLTGVAGGTAASQVTVVYNNAWI